MSMTERERVDWWLAFFRRHPELQQFGQKDDSLTNNGASGCTDLCFQALCLGWFGMSKGHYTQNEIRGLAGRGYETRTRGLFNPSEVQRVIDKTGLPYAIRYDWDWERLLDLVNARGPAIIGVQYAYQPEKRNYSYAGTRSDGKPNGYAEKNGKTQLTGFTGAHAEILVGRRLISGGPDPVFVKDPNHGSLARPERPSFDQISIPEFKKLYESYGSLGRDLFAVVPTKVFNR